MATMAPATFDIELETEMTGWMSRKGVRFWLVVALLAMARYFSRSRVTIRGVPKSKGFREQLARTAGGSASSTEAKVRGGWIKVGYQCGMAGCPGLKHCKGRKGRDSGTNCPVPANYMWCEHCGAKGEDVERDIDDRVLCQTCYDRSRVDAVQPTEDLTGPSTKYKATKIAIPVAITEVDSQWKENLSDAFRELKEACDEAKPECDRCHRPNLPLEMLDGRPMCGSCRIEVDRNRRIMRSMNPKN